VLLLLLCLQLPEGDWFCSNECNVIKTQMGALVSRALMFGLSLLHTKLPQTSELLLGHRTLGRQHDWAWVWRELLFAWHTPARQQQTVLHS
jgi:hypothetical protein